MFRSKTILFKNYCPHTHTDTHKQQTDCSIWTTKVVVDSCAYGCLGEDHAAESVTKRTINSTDERQFPTEVVQLAFNQLVILVSWSFW